MKIDTEIDENNLQVIDMEAPRIQFFQDGGHFYRSLSPAICMTFGYIISVQYILDEVILASLGIIPHLGRSHTKFIG